MGAANGTNRIYKHCAYRATRPRHRRKRERVGIVSEKYLSVATMLLLKDWYSHDLMASTSIKYTGLWARFFGLLGQHAVTLNGTIHITQHAPGLDTDMGIMLIGHELYHVGQQMHRSWWGYLLEYARGWRPRHIWNATSHPLEVPAYQRGDEVLARVREMRRSGDA